MSDKEFFDTPIGAATALGFIVLEVAAFAGAALLFLYYYGYDGLDRFDRLDLLNDPGLIAMTIGVGLAAAFVVDMVGLFFLGTSLLFVLLGGLLILVIGWVLAAIVVLLCSIPFFAVIWMFLPDNPSSDTIGLAGLASAICGIGLSWWLQYKFPKAFDGLASLPPPPNFP